MPLHLEQWHWGASPADVQMVVSSDVSKGQLRGLDITPPHELWGFLRTARETTGRVEPFAVFYSGLGSLGVVHEGTLRFPVSEFESEDEFLRRADAARANPECAFQADLEVRD